jgi:hypothetical protein
MEMELIREYKMTTGIKQPRLPSVWGKKRQPGSRRLQPEVVVFCAGGKDSSIPILSGLWRPEVENTGCWN